MWVRSAWIPNQTVRNGRNFGRLYDYLFLVQNTCAPPSAYSRRATNQTHGCTEKYHSQDGCHPKLIFYKNNSIGTPYYDQNIKVIESSSKDIGINPILMKKYNSTLKLMNNPASFIERFKHGKSSLNTSLPTTVPKVRFLSNVVNVES